GEQRDVAEHDDRRVTGQRRHVFGDELELVNTKVPKLFQVQRVHQGDHMHAGDVEAVPTCTTGSGAERASVLLAPVVDRVVFAGNGEHVRCAQPGQHLLDLIELSGCGQMGQVAAGEHALRPVTEVVD